MITHFEIVELYPVLVPSPGAAPDECSIEVTQEQVEKWTTAREAFDAAQAEMLALLESRAPARSVAPAARWRRVP